MTKYSGYVGFAVEEEVEPGLWVNKVVRVKMKGDVLYEASNFSSDGRRNVEKVHDDLNVENRISLIAGRKSYKEFMNIAYLEYLGVKWEVKSVQLAAPRFIVTLGGIWNG